MLEEIDGCGKTYFDKIKSRDFKCPCGKSYLSYAALFTHIKQKHQGKPPGKIIKPGPQNNKRGRPSHKSRMAQDQVSRLNEQSQMNNQNPQRQSGSSCQNQKEDSEQSSKLNYSLNRIIDDVCVIMEQIPQKTPRKVQLNELQAFTEMIVAISKFGQEPLKSNGVTVAHGVIEFLEEISKKISWVRFQQIYVLLTIYLQFIIDQQNNKNVLKTASMDILCQYVNDFLQNHLQAMAQHYSVDGMEILRWDVSVGIFNNLFKWMICKKYTQYSIEINSGIIERFGIRSISEYGQPLSSTCSEDYYQIDLEVVNII